MYGGHIAPLLMAHGVATVVNLRGENPKSTWYTPERAACESLSIGYLDRPLHSRRLPKKQMLIDLLNAYQSAPRPLLIKCSGGADRTALAAAIYILHRDGLDGIADARRQMAVFPYLHLPKRYQRWIRSFPEYFEADHDGLTISDWAGSRYQPEAFAEWLDQRGLGGAWRR